MRPRDYELQLTGKRDSEFVGADHVPEAKQIFEKEIADYETKNPKLPPTCDVQKEQ
jgi:hypothetical protein